MNTALLDRGIVDAHGIKTDDYGTVYRLNRHFDTLINNIDQLQSCNMLSLEVAVARKAALEETRARINFAIAQDLKTASLNSAVRKSWANTDAAFTKITCMRGDMAKPNLTSAERLAVYQVLYRINCSFHFIIRRLSQAENLNMLNRRDAHDMLGLVQEVQLEINTVMLDRLDHMELQDLATFGKVRAAMEKRLRS